MSAESDSESEVEEVDVEQLMQAHIDLSEIDRLWKTRVGSDTSARVRRETLESYKKRKEIPLDPSLVLSGVVARPPGLHSLIRTQENPSVLPGKIYDMPLSRHSCADYAAMIVRLMKSLGRSRAFVAAEFFYSDLDREW